MRKLLRRLRRRPVFSPDVLRQLPVMRDVRVIRRCVLVAEFPEAAVAPGSVQDECETCGLPIWLYLPQPAVPDGERLMCSPCVRIYLTMAELAGLRVQGAA